MEYLTYGILPVVILVILACQIVLSLCWSCSDTLIVESSQLQFSCCMQKMSQSRYISSSENFPTFLTEVFKCVNTIFFCRFQWFCYYEQHCNKHSAQVPGDVKLTHRSSKTGSYTDSIFNILNTHSVHFVVSKLIYFYLQCVKSSFHCILISICCSLFSW